ncbi:MAG TPA: FAD-binding oxidoreductase [Acidimicrobiales bacterium]|nr:FAD-binding oxidoreductase [Acidimicrobiales bacterium]
MSTQPVWWTSPQAQEDGPGPAGVEQGVEADVCVVGLGGSGLSAVIEALRLGRSVVGVDAGPIAGGAAGRNGGFLLAGAPDFHHTAVARLGRERAAAVYRLTLDELARTPQMHPVGSLRLADDGAELDDCAAMLRALHADGFAAEWHDGPEGQGVFMPHDGAFDPLARCRDLAAHATAEGARLFEHTPALDIAAHRVTTPSGPVECGAVVVAVDGGLERVLPELHGRVRTARLQMLATAPVAATITTRPVYARYGYDYWQQLPSGALALGGCRDRFADDEWSFDPTPTEPVQACLDQLARRLADAPVTHRWAGCVGFTPTRMPVCEELPTRPGVVATGGYCGTGNVLGALCGRAAVRLALNEPLGDLRVLLS